ncbi:MAG: hypothetical protein ACI8V2_002073 [Candidatus Latescibacterota bacterium]|jgi:hypothetical protein
MSQTYILGVEEDETNRLSQQHEVWAQDTQTLYQMAKFTQGHISIFSTPDPNSCPKT